LLSVFCRIFSSGEHGPFKSLIEPEPVYFLRPFLGHDESVDNTIGRFDIDCVLAVRGIESALASLGKDRVLAGYRPCRRIYDVGGKICEAGELEIGVDQVLIDRRTGIPSSPTL
jgi:hypothetical protein